MYSTLSKQENAHPEAALLVAGDFNAGKLKSVLPRFCQHVTEPLLSCPGCVCRVVVMLEDPAPY
jgi:hypothetical protein